MGLIGAKGAKKAAEQQAKIAKEVAGEWKKLGQTEYTWFQPFMQAGTETLGAQMSMLANPVNTQQSLATYYASPEYAMQEEQAQYAAETSAADPYSGMGGSATSNFLGSQSTQLGQQYLKSQAQGRQQQFTNLGGISKMGLSASGTMGNLATQDMRGIAEAAHTAGAASAQAASAHSRGLASALTGGLSAAISMFGNMSGESEKTGSSGGWLKGLTQAAATVMEFI